MIDYENKVLLRGKVKGNVKITTKSFYSTAFFCLYIVSFHSNPGGKDYAKTEIIPITVFGNEPALTAESWSVIRNLHDGDCVEVEAKLHNYKQEKDGETEYKMSVLGTNIKLIP